MNKCFFSVQTIEDPKESYGFNNQLMLTCDALLPSLGKGVPTKITIEAFSDKEKARLQSIKKDMHLFLSGCILKYDYKAKVVSVKGGNIIRVDASNFPIINEVIMTGDCGNDIDQADGRQVKFIDTEKGKFIKASQTLVVNTGGRSYSYFNIEAFNPVDAPLDLATLLIDRTRKDTALSIHGYLSTNQWIDKESGVPKSKTNIRLTRARTMESNRAKPEIKPQTETSSASGVTTLWGGSTQAATAPVETPTEAPKPEPVTATVATPAANPWGLEDDDAPF